MRRIKIISLFSLFLLVFFLAGCGKKSTEDFSSWSDFNRAGVKVGVADGYVFEEAAKKALPEADILTFPSREDAFRSLSIGEVDGVADDEPLIRSVLRQEDSFALTEGYLEPSDYAFVFPKNDEGKKHSDEMSEYVKKLKESGELALLDEKWFGSSTENKTSEEVTALEAKNGTLALAFEDNMIPFAYLSAGRPVGYDIDLAIGFCREYGYGLSIQVTDFSSMLKGVAEGNYDAGCGMITITEKRQESLHFSAPDYSGGISVVKRAQAPETGRRSIFTDLARHFRNAFLEEGRWKTFLTGILMTCALFFLSSLLGSLFGVLLFVLSQRGGPVIRWICKAVDFILHGLPVVILLFSLYYAWYNSMFLGGFLASVISLTLYFGDEVCRMLRQEAELIDNRSLLREYHLLSIDGKEFFRKLRKKSGHLLRRDYREKLITLLKFTSVVGFIGVVDMTKAFDQLRTQSFEIMIPLLFTALVYFILIRLICLVLRDP